MIFYILERSEYPQLDQFVKHHPNGGFTQCSDWGKVKSGWDFEAIVVKDDEGEIKGSISVLIQKVPYFNTTFLYAPRGPVCGENDMETLRQLKSGVDVLAKKYNAHAFRMDPDMLIGSSELISNAKELGFAHNYGPDGFEGIQARFNYRLYINGKTEEQMLANLTQNCRRKVRIAIKNNVEVKAVGEEYLEEFHRLMTITGERDNFNTRPLSYFKNFLTSMGDAARLYMGFYEGVAVCGAITTNYAGKCCYVYGASDNVHRDVMPNYLMQWEMIKWAVETNCDIYDFQGVSGNLNQEGNHMFGLYQFKSGFNGQLDELVGELDFYYKPMVTKMVDKAIDLNAALRKLKRKMGR